MGTRTADIVIIGGGLAGLAAAYAATKKGLAPLLLEERGRPGGLVCSGKIGPATVDIGAESFALRAPEVRELAQELGIETVLPQGSSWIWTHKDGGRAVPIPHGVFGIPASLDDPAFASALVEIAGEEALERARQDLELGPEAGADCEDLASFVRARMGQAVLDTFVTPFAGGIHAADPKDLAADSVAPGLRRKTRETGSLVGAVKAIRPRPVPVVGQTKGGMFRLVHALRDAVLAAGGTIESRKRATSLAPADVHAWNVRCEPTKSNPDPHLPPLTAGESELVETDRVVVATPAPVALRLLGSACEASLPSGSRAMSASLAADIASLIDGFRLPAGAPIAHVTLAVRSAALDAAPRGSGMLVSPPGPGDTPRLRAKAITHYSAKWPDTVSGTPDHTHVLRVSYGRPGENLDDLYGDFAVDTALADATTMLGVELGRDRLLDSRVIHWDGSLVPQTPEARATVAGLTALAGKTDGLVLAGAWVAGSGLAAVIPHGLKAVRE